MRDAIQEIRLRAEILHRRAKVQDSTALQRFTKFPQFDLTSIRRRDCLAVLSTEIGFASWPHAKHVLGGKESADFGTLLCPKKCGGYLNLWYKTHQEASLIRQSCGRYLLAYRSQFLVVERGYIETLGLNPDDPDWSVIDFDWTMKDSVRPGSSAARARLYSNLVAALPRESTSAREN